jgi:hypothetical protein
MNNNKYLEMTAEDQAFAEEFKRWRDADSAGALRLLRWLQRNFDPAAHACTTCGDSVRHLFAPAESASLQRLNSSANA